MKFAFTDEQETILAATSDTGPSPTRARIERALPERQAHGG